MMASKKNRRRAKRDDRPLPGQRRLLLGLDHHTIRSEHRKCGRDTCSTCVDGKGHGPYLHAVWPGGTRVRRKYLGPA